MIPHGKIDSNADLLRINDADELREMLDALSDRQAAIERRIWEIEADKPSAEPTGFRAMYYAIK